MAAKKKAKKAPPKKVAKKAAPKKKAAKKPVAKKAAKARKPAGASKKASAKAKPVAKKAASKAAPKVKVSAAQLANEGRFVWHELTTTDLPKALAFYGDLLGWTSHETPMGDGTTYIILKKGEEQVGGAMTPMPGDPSPPHWVPYCSTPDVDAAVARASKAGAMVHVPPTDIPNVGRFAVIQDPQGAVIYPFRPGTDATGPNGPPASSTFCWDECLTSDPEAATKFYGKVFGWKINPTDTPDGKYYILMRRGDVMSGGVMKLPMEGMPPNWLSHIAVDDLDAAMAKVQPLGGKLLTPRTPTGWGDFSVIADPTGAVVSLFQGKQQ